LRKRRAEIEAALLARVYSVSDPAEATDADYAASLRAAVATALDYGLAALELGEEQAPPVPPELLAQARLAACNGVGLDTVLRRYFAGFALLGDFLIGEAQEEGLLDAASLQRLMGGHSALLDRIVAAVSDEHCRAAHGNTGSTEERRASHVRRLLAGEFLDASELAYDFQAHHLGMLARGPGACEAIRRLASSLDRRLLMVGSGEGTQWAWLGSSRNTDPEQLKGFASRGWPTEVSLAIGEPAQGMEGWRLTHRQAKAALPIALRGPERLVRYADVALLASVLQDELLVRSLRQLYLVPLDGERDGGETLRRTLRAYFAAEHNVSSAAAALGVDRHTVTNRLRAVEERVGRSLSRCLTEVDAALRLEDAGHTMVPHRTLPRGL
jgi:PucR C-terminal helix-turn-helix domain/GGDEF-like domain